MSMIKVAGRLKHFVQQWYALTTDQSILDTVKHCHIEFVSDILPYQEKPSRPIKMGVSEQKIMDTEILKLLDKGIIEQCTPVEGQLSQTFFLERKKMVRTE